MNPIVCVVGAAAMLIGLIFAIAELFRRKKDYRSFAFLGVFLLLPIALFAESVILSAIGLSAMKGLLY